MDRAVPPSAPSSQGRLGPVDEGPHPGGDVWTFDWALPDGSLGGWVRLGLGADGISYHAAVAGPGQQLALVSALAVPVPRGGPFEFRSEGLWAMHLCERPFEHWTVGAEAYAVGLDDPLDAWGLAFGDRVPFGLDLEWEDAVPLATAGDHYTFGCRVTGELLLGQTAHDLDTFGTRSHTWGDADRWATAWARLDDGSWLAGEVLAVARDAGGLPVAAEAGTTDGRPVVVEPMAVSPVVLDGGAHVARALCRLSAAGTAGIGWIAC
jgi:hypothetical protein